MAKLKRVARAAVSQVVPYGVLGLLDFPMCFAAEKCEGPCGFYLVRVVLGGFDKFDVCVAAPVCVAWRAACW